MKISYRPDRTIDHRLTAARSSEEFASSGLSQRQLAKRMRLSPPYLCDLLQGRRNWSEALALRFDRALGHGRKLKKCVKRFIPSNGDKHLET